MHATTGQHFSYRISHLLMKPGSFGSSPRVIKSSLMASYDKYDDDESESSLPTAAVLV